MKNYNVQYKRFIEDKKTAIPNKLKRAKFYLLSQYIDVDGNDNSYTDIESPILFTLYVSRVKDIVHAVKISGISPQFIKKFFGKLVNEDTSKLELDGDSRVLYKKYVSKFNFLTEDAYRTYKLSGIKRIFELDIDETKITPSNRQAKSIDKKSQK